MAASTARTGRVPKGDAMNHVIERDVQECSNILPDLGPGIQWVRSYVADDRTYSVRISHVRTIDSAADDD
jgi:hypothetical protein